MKTKVASKKGRPRKAPQTRFTISLENSIYKSLKNEADGNTRTLSGQIEFFLKNIFRDPK